ncbi:hypothetical protein [Agathobacter sp.]
MLKDIKLGFKLLKYSYKLKLNAGMLILFLIIGAVVEVMTKGTSIIGGVYFMLCGMFAYQLVMSMDVSQMIQSTAMKKKIQIYIPSMVSFIIYMVIYTFLVVERVILIQNHVADAKELAFTLFSIDIVMVSVFLFTSICYKYFILGFIVFLVIFMGSYTVLMMSGVIAVLQELPFGVIVIMGYAIIILGTAFLIGMGNLLYKKPLSEFAFRGLFRDAK